MSALAKLALRATRKQHEHDFVIAMDGLVLRGQIDLWFEHNRELILVDYKTDQMRKPIDSRRVAYGLQLRLYAMALETMTGRPVTRAYLHFLRPDELVEVDLSPLELNAAREQVRLFLNAQGSSRLSAKHWRSLLPLRILQGHLPCPASHRYRSFSILTLAIRLRSISRMVNRRPGISTSPALGIAPS